MSTEAFRTEVANWLAEHFTDAVKAAAEGSEERREWTRKLAGRGWTAPNWPAEYGGAGLDFQHHIVLVQEMRKVGATIPDGGMGMTMIGPTLLEYGTEEQKQRHLPKIVSREVRWCQGYSEPGAGSDLAGLATRAVLDGDHYIINGQKIWTSGADQADWMFALVRTDPDAPKHDGISMILLDMHQPGVTVKPIRLISGASPFCETFFDNALASKDDLVGELNHGWTIGKRLLQHERGGLSGMGADGAASSQPARRAAFGLAETAKRYIGAGSDGRIADAAFREELLRYRMEERAFQATLARTREENASGKMLGDVTSIFKAIGSEQSKTLSTLMVRAMGAQGTGWEGEGFNGEELAWTRQWLGARASTIAGGTNEVQFNIIAKRVLGLPD